MSEENGYGSATLSSTETSPQAGWWGYDSREGEEGSQGGDVRNYLCHEESQVVLVTYPAPPRTCVSGADASPPRTLVPICIFFHESTTVHLGGI